KTYQRDEHEEGPRQYGCYTKRYKKADQHNDHRFALTEATGRDGQPWFVDAIHLHIAPLIQAGDENITSECSDQAGQPYPKMGRHRPAVTHNKEVDRRNTERTTDDGVRPREFPEGEQGPHARRSGKQLTQVTGA